MKIYIASDHAGYTLKSLLVPYLRSLGHAVEDMGAHEVEFEDDYPDYVFPLAHRIVEEEGSIGIVIGASGQGEAMAANRIKGVRAAVYYSPSGVPQIDNDDQILNILQSTRAHNNANVLSFGARFLTEEQAQDAIRIFIETPFSGDERHMRRLAKLDD